LHHPYCVLEFIILSEDFCCFQSIIDIHCWFAEPITASLHLFQPLLSGWGSVMLSHDEKAVYSA
jgi:hypothetical protein